LNCRSFLFFSPFFYFVVCVVFFWLNPIGFPSLLRILYYNPLNIVRIDSTIKLLWIYLICLVAPKATSLIASDPSVEYLRWILFSSSYLLGTEDKLKLLNSRAYFSLFELNGKKKTRIIVQ
jgi:hypothetical protein